MFVPVPLQTPSQALRGDHSTRGPRDSLLLPDLKSKEWGRCNAPCHGTALLALRRP